MESPGSRADTYIKTVLDIYKNRTDFTVGNSTEGQPYLEPDGVWRTHSTFHPQTGRRRSSDTVLDRSNKNLVIETNARVDNILFDGDADIPTKATFAVTGVPRARCVVFATSKVVCVKKEGRIYLSAGALHTPELLIKIGIGPNGARVDNSNVSQNDVEYSQSLVRDQTHSFARTYRSVNIFRTNQQCCLLGVCNQTIR